MNKTKKLRINRYYRLASRYRPRAPEPLEQVIRVLVRRQQKINYLVRSGRRLPARDVSVTIDNLAAYTGLTRKQVRDALETLREAGLIKFERQHNGRRCWGRALYNCQALVIEVYKPVPNYARLMAEADYRAYLADRAQEPEVSTGGWGTPRYDEELRREVKEAIREARAEQQAAQYEDELALYLVAETFIAGVEHIRTVWGLRDAEHHAAFDGPDHDDGPDAETREAMAFDREEFLAELMIHGPLLAWLGLPDYQERLHQHFPDLYAQVMS